MGTNCDSESLLQKQGLYQVIQQGHGKPGKHQRICQPIPTDIVVPLNKGRPIDSPTSQHGLNNVSNTGYGKPYQGPEIGEQPPILAEKECQKGGNKTKTDLTPRR